MGSDCHLSLASIEIDIFMDSLNVFKGKVAGFVKMILWHFSQISSRNTVSRVEGFDNFLGDINILSCGFHFFVCYPY